MASQQLPWSLPVISIVGICLLAVGIGLYRLALPKPIPGIPYSVDSANRILGDVPDALKWHRERSEIFTFLTAQAVKHRSPIAQVFLRPFGKPWVILTDFREAQDIMTRRTREFDRSAFFGDLFFNLGPGNQVHMPTGDVWRAHRRLMADTMSNAFMNDVAGPQIYSSALVMINLWSEKMRLANGQSFDASVDVGKGALDAIWAATFGSEIGTTSEQLKLLSGLDESEVVKNADGAITFPSATDPEAFIAIMTLSNSVEIALNSPIPRLHHGLALKLMPSLVSARKVKDQLLKRHLDAAWERLQDNEKDDAVKSAMDLVVQREAIMAKKEGRAAQYDTQAVRDELFGFLVAGHETTATTICWGLKFLTKHQHTQQKLRSTLQAEFKRAWEDGDNPTVAEIVKSNIPYLDATLEETHRCGGTVSSNVRTALVNANILGHWIPKGTDVFMISSGPGYVDTPLQVDESERSRSSQDSKDKNGEWEVTDIGTFKPERWLVSTEKGDSQFDPRAGPALPFGAGPRRKLASLELKIIMTLIVWNFELKPTPPPLSSFAGLDKITHVPQQCYLQLATAR
ncbi:hypothetical protein LTR36_009508 [Oleoguttula mirabilis]|uniref:Cytochrome P450 n=1 Tax=Oleoguttula mirabilis TaxID=1507867 RepID=A0AAV9JSZ4_9PEZI|nr:hypothetical protein LTR36_009508 [Oleoguttula mirabilis]